MGSTTKTELLEIPGAEGVSVDFFNKLLGQEAPTKGVPTAMNVPLQGIAGLGVHEQTTQDLLGKFLGTSATEGEGYKLGIEEIKKTLGGEFYDPKTSDFWKGFRETSAMEQEQGVADIRRRGQLGGGLYATPGQRVESDYQRAKEAERTTMLGGLYEKERDRRTNAVGQALGYAGFEEAGKTSRLTAGATIGAIPRGIEGQKLAAKYTQQLGQETVDYQQRTLQSESDYAKELFPYQYQAPISAMLMPQWSIQEQESPLGGILGIMGSIIGAGK